MALNTINPIQVEKKKDPMDVILQGLQIANQVFQIPVAYQNLKTAGLESELKKQQVDAATAKTNATVALKAGDVSQAEAAGVSLVPGEAPKAALTIPKIGAITTEDKPILTPPTQRFGKLTPYTTSKEGVPYYEAKQFNESIEQERKLAQGIEKSAPVAIAEQAALNFRNAKSAFEDFRRSGGKDDAAGDALIAQFVRLKNPGVARAADSGDATAVQNLTEGIARVKSFFAGGTPLTTEKAAEFFNQSKKLARNAFDNAEGDFASQRELAKSTGFREDFVGVKDFKKEFPDLYAAPTQKQSSSDSPKMPANKPPVVIQGGHTFHLNPKTGQYE